MHSDSDSSDFSDDEELAHIREQRMAKMKAEQRKIQNLISQGHGSYRQIDEGQFLKEVTASPRAVVHFFHPEFERCKLLDQHLDYLAQTHVETKFLKIEAAKAPFFVTKLQIQVLPCLIFFWNGVAKDRMVGFERLPNQDSFDTTDLENVLIQSGVLDVLPTEE
ncbi:hypothetical protein GEMRC1_005997 [Eukaryota sp. GEM-RC1]